MINDTHGVMVRLTRRMHPLLYSRNAASSPSINFPLSINPGGVVGATPLQEYSGLTGDVFLWTANVSAGTSIQLSLTDSTGTIAQAAPVTIQSGRTLRSSSRLFPLLSG